MSAAHDDGWTESEAKTLRGRRKGAGPRRRPTPRQKEGLVPPPPRKVNRAFVDNGVASAVVAKKEREREEGPSARPDWMHDPSLLPKRPPGRP